MVKELHAFTSSFIQEDEENVMEEEETTATNCCCCCVGAAREDGVASIATSAPTANPTSVANMIHVTKQSKDCKHCCYYQLEMGDGTRPLGARPLEDTNHWWQRHYGRACGCPCPHSHMITMNWILSMT
eukprot:13320386-Ditylum_brightwellii.AAC.1